MKTLVHAAFPPEVTDFWMARMNPLWSRQRVLARVIARRQEAEGTVTLTLRANGNWRGFVPGQHVNVSAEIDGARMTRSYSPAPVAGKPMQLTLTVKQVEGGRFSHWLCDPARVGTVLALDAAFGDMTLAANRAGAVLLAAGSGITPFISMIRAQAGQALTQPLTLLYWARTRAELCFVAELEALAAREPLFRVHFITTREAGGEGHAAGRLHAAQLALLVPDLAGQAVCACGPADFVSLAGELAAAAGCSFAGEAFTAPVVAFEPGQQVLVTLARSGRKISVPAGQPLLAALEAQGLRPASGCRRGICNTCACGKAAGTSENVLTRELQSEAVPSLKICISSARSDLTLDL